MCKKKTFIFMFKEQNISDMYLILQSDLYLTMPYFVFIKL